MKQILITGGAGFIGAHLARRLLGAGYRVRLFDCLEQQVHAGGGLPAYLPDGVELVRGDVRDSAALGAALEGVEAVFHMAAIVGVGQSQYEILRYTSTNVLGTAALLDALANGRHRVAKLVVASSMSVYGEGSYRRPSDGATAAPGSRAEARLAARDFEVYDVATCERLEPVATSEHKPLCPASIYALNKRDQEEYCLVFGRTRGLPVVAARFFNTYGPYQSLSNPYTGAAAIFLAQLKNGRAPAVFEDGLQRRDLVDVRDVARACQFLLEDARCDGEAVNVGTGRPVTILELAGVLAGVVGSALAPEVLYAERKGDVRHCWADITKLRRLGFAPEIGLEEGLAHLYAWARHEPALDALAGARQELAARGLLVQR